MAVLRFAALAALLGGATAATFFDTSYSSVTAGQFFSCGVLKSTGRIDCWGNGALGDPMSLTMLEGQLMDKNHLSISGGGFHVCGLYYEGEEERRVNVKAYCVASFEDGAPQDAGQLDIPDLGGKFWRRMSAGGQHSCGIDRDRMVHCWGSEEDNRRNLGVYAGMQHRLISAGGKHTCGVLLDHTAYCVGDGDQAILPEEYASTQFAMLEAGGAYSYGLVKGSKELITFGPGASTIPTTPPSGFRKSRTLSIAAGANHVCAIGRRTRKAIRSGLASKGVWCAGNDGEEVTGIVEPRPENDP